MSIKLISGNKWWSTKIDAKLLSDVVTFSILSSDIPLDFQKPSSASKIFNILLNIQTWNIPKEKHFATLRILNLSIKCFADPFVALTF